MRPLLAGATALAVAGVLLTACEDGVTPRVASTISVTPSSVSLLVGETANLQATVFDQHGDAFGTLPEGLTVSLSSSNTSVVTVSGMQITAVGAGTGTVTVSAGDASAQVPVTVGNAPTTIQVSPTSLSLAVDQSADLTVTILDQDGNPMTSLPPGYEIGASSQNTSVATVNGLTVHGVGDGSTSVTVSAGSLTPVSVPVEVQSGFPGCAVIAHTFGSTVSAALTSSDCSSINRAGRYAKFYALSLQSSVDVQIDMMSSEVDAYLYLWTADGNLITHDDDGGSGLNSRIIRTLSAGDYVIEATTFGSGETGSFQLQTQERTPGETLQGSMSFDYSGAVSGEFAVDASFQLDENGWPIGDNWAVTFYNTEWGDQDLIAFRTYGDGAYDVVYLWSTGQVQSPGTHSLEGYYLHRADTSDEEFFIFQEGTITYEAVSADRLGGTFQGTATEEQSGQTLTAADGTFDLPIVDDFLSNAAALPATVSEAVRARNRLRN